MYTVDLVDETFIVAPQHSLALRIADPQQWRVWWPDQRLEVFLDRGDKGVRWSVSGALIGSSEIWLEPFGDGVIVHYFLRADPADPDRPGEVLVPQDTAAGRRAAARLRRRAATGWKRSVWALKAEMEGVREVGS